MQFHTYFNESSLNDLHQSAVHAFPRTTKRQHATQTVRIEQVGWTPYLGVRTLYVKGLAQNNGKEYNPAILFRNVNYQQDAGNGVVELQDNNGQRHLLEQLSLDGDVLLRCNCNDFYWRFNYYNHVDGSLNGRVRAPYEGQGVAANPMEMPGMCKHLMKLAEVLGNTGYLQ